MVDLLRSDPRVRVLATPLLLSVAAMVWVAVTTGRGLLQGPDSTIYLATADAIRRGRGPSVPFTFYWDHFSPHSAVGLRGRVPSTHFPPGYPYALAAVSLATRRLATAARLLDIVLVGVNVFLVGWLAARLTSYRSAVVAALPAALLLLFPDQTNEHAITIGWLRVHQAVASEPLFITCFTLALVIAPDSIAKDRVRARRAMFLLAALTGAAIATRYAGVALAIALGLVLFSFDPFRRLPYRAFRAASFVAIALAPTFAYFGWAAVHGGGPARTLSFHPTGANPGTIMDWFGRFLFPPLIPTYMRIVALLAVLAVLCWALSAPRAAETLWGGVRSHDPSLTLAQVVLITLPCYAVVVLAAHAFLDTHVPLDPRLLAPVRGAFLALVFSVAWRMLVVSRTSGRSVSVAIGAVAICAVIAGWPVERGILDSEPPSPLAPTSVQLTAARLPRDALVASNAPDVLWHATGRESIVLPTPRDYLSNEVNPDYDAQVRAMASILVRYHGYIYLTASFTPTAGPTELGRYMTLAALQTRDDEVLYVVKPLVPTS